MDDRMLAFKLAVTAFFGGAAELLGWKGVMLLILPVLMCLDWISGSLAAKRRGEWSSEVAREGLFHKGGTILVTTAALIADLMFTWALPEIPLIRVTVPNPGLFLPLVLTWYIVTEIGSILENAMKMGAPVPAWFRRAIQNVGKAVDKVGDKVTKEDEDAQR